MGVASGIDFGVPLHFVKWVAKWMRIQFKFTNRYSLESQHDSSNIVFRNSNIVSLNVVLLMLRRRRIEMDFCIRISICYPFIRFTLRCVSAQLRTMTSHFSFLVTVPQLRGLEPRLVNLAAICHKGNPFRFHCSALQAHGLGC